MELDDLPSAAIVVDADRRITDANAAACALAGQDLVGVALDDVLCAGDDDPPWDGWHPSSRLRSVRGVPERVARLRLPTGHHIPVVASGRYRRDEAGELQSAVIELRLVRPRGRHVPSGIEIVSTVSHELRSPLTSVKGYTSLLLNRWDRLGDDQKKMMLTQVHHDADRVTRLVTELLDISRLETGRLHLRRQLVDLVALATNVVEKLGVSYEGMACSLDFSPDFPKVYADPDKVEQVLTNLVENAAKYASPEDIRVVGRVEDGFASIAVHDKGEGIPAADLPRVFTKFFRRDHGKPTGSGLGLWISRGLVEAHGGRLLAESNEGEGSTFTFTLPTDAFEQMHEG
ncbi:MAG TPA: HAMP domain-containing sensor histidine kinase [Acidimicrobiales bacterium]|nr:HAMP domain-containing sensor histidine kinase [Acidimicrobiales bacterium]